MYVCMLYLYPISIRRRVHVYSLPFVWVAQLNCGTRGKKVAADYFGMLLSRAVLLYSEDQCDVAFKFLWGYCRDWITYIIGLGEKVRVTCYISRTIHSFKIDVNTYKQINTRYGENKLNVKCFATHYYYTHTHVYI